MSVVTELARELEQKRTVLHNLFEAGKTNQVDPVTGAAIFDWDDNDVVKYNQMETELKEMEQRFQAARLAEGREENLNKLRELHEPNRKYPVATGVTGPGGGGSRADFLRAMQPDKRLSDLVMESKAFMGRDGGKKFIVDLPDVDFKTLLATGTGYSAPNPRTGIVIPSAQRTPVVADLIPQDPTTNSSIKYMEETTFTNAANTVSEGTAKPEAALAWTERTANVEKIATWLPVTEEQLDDVAQMRNLLDNRLTLMVLLIEETHLLNGSGGIDGFMHRAGTSTQAFDTNNADTIYKAFTKVRFTGFAEPSGVVIHPDNWQTIRLSKTSGSGEYIMGAPSVDGGGAINVAGVETIWGKPVVITTAITSGQALTGDFVKFAHISRRMGLRVEVTDSHSDYFVYNILAIRAEIRESLEVYRNAAFCKMSGLT